jgi:hypothetical protein
MSFFSRLFAKLFGRKKENTFAPTPGVVVPTYHDVRNTSGTTTPPYATTGKFQDHQKPAVERIPAISQPVNVNTEGWPVGTYEFQPGVYYVPYKGSNGGPFKEPKEAVAWMAAIDRNIANSQQNEQDWKDAVYRGTFPALNFIHGPQQGDEAAFIYAASRIYREMMDKRGIFNSDMYRNEGLFTGTNNEIAQLINYGEQEQLYQHKTFAQTLVDFPDTPVGRAVREVLAK